MLYIIQYIKSNRKRTPTACHSLFIAGVPLPPCNVACGKDAVGQAQAVKLERLDVHLLPPLRTPTEVSGENPRGHVHFHHISGTKGHCQQFWQSCGTLSE